VREIYTFSKNIFSLALATLDLILVPAAESFEAPLSLEPEFMMEILSENAEKLVMDKEKCNLS